MKFLIIFIFLISNTLANEMPDIKNIIVNKEFKRYQNITFKDSEENLIKLSDYKGNLVMLNFWATWCAPCKVPSRLFSKQSEIGRLKIFPINVGKDNNKFKKIFKDLKIKNLSIYFDNEITLAKDFSLRGLPTTILLIRRSRICKNNWIYRFWRYKFYRMDI